MIPGALAREVRPSLPAELVRELQEQAVRRALKIRRANDIHRIWAIEQAPVTNERHGTWAWLK